MKTVEILSLPKNSFAHVFDAPKYTNQFPAQNNRIEVTYLYKGGFLSASGEGDCRLEEGDLCVNLFDSKRRIAADAYHCHHTVSAMINIKIGDDLPDGLYLPVRTPAKIVPSEVYHLVDDLIYLHNMQMLDTTRGRTEFLELLCLIDACNRKAESSRLSGGTYLADKAKKYISNHIHEPITQREVAAQLRITPGHLCYVFKASQGETFMRYVNRIKLRNIRSLMKNEALSLREASASFGYSDPNYVSRLYKQIFGKNITFGLEDDTPDTGFGSDHFKQGPDITITV